MLRWSNGGIMAYDYKPPTFKTIGYQSGYVQIKTLNSVPCTETITAIVNIAKREPGKSQIVWHRMEKQCKTVASAKRFITQCENKI